MRKRKPGKRAKGVDTRFWSKVDKGDEDWHCWEWTGAIADTGYGAFMREHKGLISAHRMAYRLALMHPPEPEVVMHLCDNRRCANPLHLKGATYKENNDDMIRKGRYRGCAWPYVYR